MGEAQPTRSISPRNSWAVLRSIAPRYRPWPFPSTLLASQQLATTTVLTRFSLVNSKLWLAQETWPSAFRPAGIHQTYSTPSPCEKNGSADGGTHRHAWRKAQTSCRPRSLCLRSFKRDSAHSGVPYSDRSHCVRIGGTGTILCQRPRFWIVTALSTARRQKGN